MANCYCQDTKFHRIRPFLLVVIATVSGCINPVRHANQLAETNGLQPALLQGTSFEHHAFGAIRGPSGLLVLFIDGDGTPWVHGGRRVAADPTPRAPLALELAAATPASVLYLGRPCYFEARMPPQCKQSLWTSGRYSPAVVESMSAAANSYIAEHRFRRVLIVGYSGGGALAVLMARRLPGVAGVVTIAGNLDPDAWTKLHGYLPLDGSLNPSLEPPLPSALKQWYYVGGRDTNVPPSIAGSYAQRAAPDRLRSYPDFGHVCCWRKEWPAMFAGIIAELDSAGGGRSGDGAG